MKEASRFFKYKPWLLPRSTVILPTCNKNQQKQKIFSGFFLQVFHQSFSKRKNPHTACRLNDSAAENLLHLLNIFRLCRLCRLIIAMILCQLIQLVLRSLTGISHLNQLLTKLLVGSLANHIAIVFQTGIELGQSIRYHNFFLHDTYLAS